MGSKKFNMSLPSEFNGSCKALKPKPRNEGFIKEIQPDSADTNLRSSTPALANYKTEEQSKIIEEGNVSSKSSDRATPSARGGPLSFCEESPK